VPVILDPAPARADIPAELYSLADIITPNEIEASQLAGFPVSDTETAALAAAFFRRRGAGTAIVKLGERGVFCTTAEENFFVPAFPVRVADTVAAGDAFNGALAAAIAAGKPLRQAVIWGAAAGALCATKAGAQPSLPHRQEFEAFLRERGVEL
jgi:ribokinase